MTLHLIKINRLMVQYSNIMTYYISDTSCFVFVYFLLLHHDSTLLCKEWIYLYENDITGPIPSSFGNLISIGKLIDYKTLYDFSTPSFINDFVQLIFIFSAISRETPVITKQHQWDNPIFNWQYG